MVEIVKFSSANGHPKDMEELIDWLREHEKEGNVKRLCVMFEDENRKVYSRSINLRNKDLLWFLFKEMLELMGPDDE